jgi:hypothetical protein
MHFIVQRHARTVFEPQLRVQPIHCQVGAAELDVGLEDAIDGRQVSLIRLEQLPRTGPGVKSSKLLSDWQHKVGGREDGMHRERKVFVSA